MNIPRIIPILLLQDKGFVKTKRFKNPTYIGDPINTVRIFNEKEVDEIIILDIEASKNFQVPNFELLTSIAAEAFMPLGYGGGLSSIDQIKKVFELGFEKVIINSSTFSNYKLIEDAVKIFGSQSVVGCIDIKKSIFAKRYIYSHAGRKKQKINIEKHINNLIKAGIGELIIQCIDLDGTRNGYDYNFLNKISKSIEIPTIGLGGAKDLNNMLFTFNQTDLSALAAGSIFVYFGPHNAVLINYPEREEILQLFRKI
tara:strand:+ start:1640 stop:2407 length:768 start_codon:yes stop_codon:yes gene_type:complete